jgi:hypothetical protein
MESGCRGATRSRGSIPLPVLGVPVVCALAIRRLADDRVAESCRPGGRVRAGVAFPNLDRAVLHADRFASRASTIRRSLYVEVTSTRNISRGCRICLRAFDPSSHLEPATTTEYSRHPGFRRSSTYRGRVVDPPILLTTSPPSRTLPERPDLNRKSVWISRLDFLSMLLRWCRVGDREWLGRRRSRGVPGRPRGLYPPSHWEVTGGRASGIVAP